MIQLMSRCIYPLYIVGLAQLLLTVIFLIIREILDIKPDIAKWLLKVSLVITCILCLTAFVMMIVCHNKQ